MQLDCGTQHLQYIHSRDEQFMNTLKKATEDDDLEMFQSLKPNDQDLYWGFYMLTHNYLKNKNIESKIALYCVENVDNCGFGDQMLRYLIKDNKSNTLAPLKVGFDKITPFQQKNLIKFAEESNNNCTPIIKSWSSI